MNMIKSTVFKSMQKLHRTANPVNNYLESLEWEGHIPFKVGMPNISQNCYVNASLQAFLAMPPFVSTMKMIGREYGYMIAHSPYMEPLQNMLDILAYAYSSDGRSYNNAINRFLENLYISKSFGFRTIRNRQEDSKDFINSLNDYLDKMMTILNAISQNLDAPTESKNFFTRNFSFTRDVYKFCENMHDHVLPSRTNGILDIMVSGSDLQMEIKRHFSRKTLEYCISCGNAWPTINAQLSHYEKSTLTSLPDILGICLHFPLESQESGKKKHHTLFIQDTFAFDNVDESILNYQYELISAIFHHGSSVGSGHYTSVSKNIYDCTWNHFNDSIINYDIKHMDYLNDPTFSNGQPYLLFYKKNEERLNQLVSDETLTFFEAGAGKITCKYKQNEISFKI